MAFIEKSDITNEIKPEELEQITRGDDTILNYGIDVAMSEIKGYLYEYYDTDRIFSQTGSDRHSLLVNFAVDIAIYIIVSAALPGQDLEDRRARYKRAIDWLEKLKKGEIVTDLPVRETDPDTTPVTRGVVSGRDTKRNNYY